MSEKPEAFAPAKPVNYFLGVLWPACHPEVWGGEGDGDQLEKRYWGDRNSCNLHCHSYPRIRTGLEKC